MPWIKPKIDWTEYDYHNAVDMNRVESNTQEIASLILQLTGVDVGLETPVTDRDYSTIEFADGLNRIERNLEKLSVFPLEGLGELKTNWEVGESFSYVDARRLETNLSILYPMMNKNANNLLYCGEVICGEGVL